MHMRSDPCTPREAEALYARARSGDIADKSGVNNSTYLMVPEGRDEPVVLRIPQGAFAAFDEPAAPGPSIEPPLRSPIVIWEALSRSAYTPNLLHVNRHPDYMIVSAVVDGAGNAAPTLGSLDPGRNPGLRARMTVDMPRIFGSFDRMTRGDFADGRPPLAVERDDVGAFLEKRDEWIRARTSWWEDPDIAVLCDRLALERDLVAPAGRRETRFAPSPFGFAHVSLHGGNVLVTDPTPRKTNPAPPGSDPTTFAIDLDRGIWAPLGFNMAAHLRSVVYQYTPAEVAAMKANYGREHAGASRAALLANFERIKNHEVRRECAAYVWDLARLVKWARDGRPVSERHWNLRIDQLHGSANNVSAYVTGAPLREHGEITEMAKYAARFGVQALKQAPARARRWWATVATQVPAGLRNAAASADQLSGASVRDAPRNTTPEIRGVVVPRARDLPAMRAVRDAASPRLDTPAQPVNPPAGRRTASAKRSLDRAKRKP